MPHLVLRCLLKRLPDCLYLPLDSVKQHPKGFRLMHWGKIFCSAPQASPICDLLLKRLKNPQIEPHNPRSPPQISSWTSQLRSWGGVNFWVHCPLENTTFRSEATCGCGKWLVVSYQKSLLSHFGGPRVTFRHFWVKSLFFLFLLSQINDFLFLGT